MLNTTPNNTIAWKELSACFESGQDRKLASAFSSICYRFNSLFTPFNFSLKSFCTLKNFRRNLKITGFFSRFLVLISLGYIWSFSVLAEDIKPTEEVEPTEEVTLKKEDSWYSDFKVLPFGFVSDSIGNSIGAAGVLKGVGQPQAALLGATFVSDKGSYMTSFGAYNYELNNRWLFDFDAYLGEFKDYDYYFGHATRNNSSRHESVETDGKESRLRMKFHYVLPIGLGKEQAAQASYSPLRDITGMNPIDSGVTTINFTPFYRARKLDDSDDVGFEEDESTWGVIFGLDWDNRDSVRNTTKGSHTLVNFTYAPDMGNDDYWSTWEFQNSQYFDIGSLGNIFNKQVIAFDFYTAGSPSWDKGSDGEHRPPEYAGVRLGGLYRQRGFTSGRFTGRAAINYSLEYRVMPDWQPLQNWPVFDWYNVPWWQWVLFADVGRVADDYDISDLHQNMQTSFGGGVRFQVENIVIRTEVAWADNDNMFRIMVNQPF